MSFHVFHPKFEKEVWVLEHNDDIRDLWDTRKEVLREVDSNAVLSQGTRKISNNLTLHLKQLEKEEQIKPKKLVEEKKL